MEIDRDRWDEDLLKDIFEQRDISLILLIPVNRSDNDSWFWRHDKMGQYTVKSAYDIIRSRATSNQSSSNSSFWNKIWNLKIPLKVKHFVWRAIRDCLPTKDRLIIRKVEVDSKCPVCNLAEETVFHALVICPVAQLCWRKLGHNWGSSSCLEDWIGEILQHSSRNDMNKVFMVAWAIWKNRNAIVWSQKSQEYDDIVTSALRVLSNWESAQDKSFDNTVGFLTQTDGDVHWKQPQNGTVKVNTDAALFDNSNCYSYAMVARDQSGAMLEAVSCCRSGRPNPEIAEAIGIREALSWVKQKSWSSTIVESDCLGAVQAIRCSSINLSYFGRVIDECKKLLGDLESRNVTLKFVKRSANMVAHYIVRNSSSLADRNWGRGDAYPDLLHVLMNDLRD